MKKILFTMGVLTSLLLAPLILKAQISDFSPLKLSGIYIVPKVSTWILGTSTMNGVFNNITINGSCTGCPAGGSGAESGWRYTTPVIRLSTSTDVVGIGTTTPRVKLFVNGSTTVSDTLAIGSLQGLLKASSTTGGYSIIGTATSGVDYEFPLTFSAPMLRNSNTISLGISAVSSSRAINTTAPIFGGGDLSADRTLVLGIDAVSSSRAINTSGFITGGGNLSADRTLTLSITPVSTTRAINTSGFITGGGDLSADRTLTLSITPVSSTRAINTSGNLSGGGDLSADRTLVLTPSVTTTNIYATSTLQIPNGTAPVLSAAGMIALDTSDDQLLVQGNGTTTLRAFPIEQSLFGVTIASSSLLNGVVIPIPKLIDQERQILKFSCLATGGTSVAVTVSSTASITCGTTYTSSTVSANNVFHEGDTWSLNIGVVTGNVDYLSFEARGAILGK